MLVGVSSAKKHWIYGKAIVQVIDARKYACCSGKKENPCKMATLSARNEGMWSSGIQRPLKTRKCQLDGLSHPAMGGKLVCKTRTMADILQTGARCINLLAIPEPATLFRSAQSETVPSLPQEAVTENAFETELTK